MTVNTPLPSSLSLIEMIALCVIPFFMGFLLGFQSLSESYPFNPSKALKTLQAWIYLFIRGIIPTITFAYIFANRLIELNPILLAIVCGGGTEVILRSEIFIKKINTPEGEKDLFKGPFDLLKWLQNYFLSNIDDILAEDMIDTVNQYYTQVKGETNFSKLCDRILINSGSFSDADKRARIETAVNKWKEKWEMEKDSITESQEKFYKSCFFKLCYELKNVATEKAWKTLFKE